MPRGIGYGRKKRFIKRRPSRRARAKKIARRVKRAVRAVRARRIGHRA